MPLEPGLIVFIVSCIVMGLVVLFMEKKGTHKEIRANRLLADGRLFNEEGRYAEAERAYRAALAIREARHGPDHVTVAIILNSLALTLHALARHDEAEAMFGRALAILKGASARHQPSMARALSNLGRLYSDQGRFPDAESCHRRALAILEELEGSDHPDVATCLNNLAQVEKHLGREV